MNNPSCSYRNNSLQLECTGDYRFGFNGKENDQQYLQDYGLRNYVTNLGRFFAVDPLTKSFPWYSTYQFAGNKPIIAIDLDGAEEFIRTRFYDENNSLYRTEIQVMGDFESSDNSPYGMGPTQLVHETIVRMTGPNSATAQYIGTSVGNRVMGTGNNPPTSTAFNATENQMVANQTNLGLDPNGVLEIQFRRIWGKNRAIGTHEALQSGNNIATVRTDAAGNPIYTPVGPFHTGIDVVVSGTPPMNEPYLPLGFNLTPPNPANRFRIGGGTLPLSVKTLNINTNLFNNSFDPGTTQNSGVVGPPQTTTLPSRTVGERQSGPNRRNANRNSNITL